MKYEAELSSARGTNKGRWS